MFGSARCGNRIKCAAPSFTGVTFVPFTIADQSVVPSGNIKRKFGFPPPMLTYSFKSHLAQYRRLFMRLPHDQPRHRARLLDAMAGLLVELHRRGVFWGDCSLASTLFSRDGRASCDLAVQRPGRPRCT